MCEDMFTYPIRKCVDITVYINRYDSSVTNHGRHHSMHLHIIADNSFASNAMVISNGLSVIYVYSRPYSSVIIYYSCIYHYRNG